MPPIRSLSALCLAALLCAPAARADSPVPTGAASAPAEPAGAPFSTLDFDWRDASRERVVPVRLYLPDSAELRNGRLVITARKESRNGKNYTSARINTRDRFAFRYGRIEARMKLPKGQGLWPAFWLLPQDPAYGTWAASGEIDIVEARNPGSTGGNTIYGTLHYGGQSPNNVYSGEQYAVATDVTADFHVFALEWDEAEIRWYVDGILFAVRNTWSTTAAPFPAPFNKPFYILLNVAVGGNFPGSPTASTVFPVTMEVDYVRVYSGKP